MAAFVKKMFDTAAFTGSDNVSSSPTLQKKHLKGKIRFSLFNPHHMTTQTSKYNNSVIITAILLIISSMILSFP